MVNLLKTCFADKWAGWEDQIKELIPTLGQKLNNNASLYTEVKDRTDKVLRLN